MSSQNQYTKQQQQQTGDYNDRAFHYWLLFSLLVVLMPCTLWAYRTLFPKAPKKAVECNCPGCTRKIQLKAKEVKDNIKSLGNYIKFGLLTVLWLVFLIALFNVTKGGIVEHEPYNPYTVLNLSGGASEDEIKKAYRSLSKQYHPDKNPGFQDKFIAISKAYEALTDPAIRENMEKYGNPDGPQPISVGIALPSWLINKSNSGLVDVLQNTMGLYYHTIDEKTRLKSLLDIVGASAEYNTLPERTTDEEDIKTVLKAIPDAHKLKKFRFKPPYSNKVTTLLYAHISRVQLPEKLEDDLQVVLKLIKMSQCITQSAWEEQSLKQIPYFDSFIINSFERRKINDIIKLKRTPEDKRKEYMEAQSLTPSQITDIENVITKLPTEVGISYKLVSEDDGVIYSSAVCTIEITVIDTAPKKKEQPALKSATDSPVTNGTPSSPATTSESSALSPAPKRKGMASKKGQKAKLKEERKLQKELDMINADDKKKSKKSSNKAEKKKVTSDDSDSDSDASDNEDEKPSSSANKQADSDDDSMSDISDSDSGSDSDSDWEAPVKKTTKPSDNFYHSPFTNDERPVSWWVVFGDRLKNELVALGKVESHEPGTAIKIPFLTPTEPGTYNYSLHLLCDGYIGCDAQTTVTIKVVQNPTPMAIPQRQQAPQTKKELKELKKKKQ
eukprot:gene10907-12712_t